MRCPLDIAPFWNLVTLFTRKSDSVTPGAASRTPTYRIYVCFHLKLNGFYIFSKLLRPQSGRMFLMISHCVLMFNPFLLLCWDSAPNTLSKCSELACGRWSLALTMNYDYFRSVSTEFCLFLKIYELTLLTAFKRSWFLLSNWPIMPIDPNPPPMPPNPNFKSFCTNDGWCKWLPTSPPTLWLPRCPLCGPPPPWPCEFCDERMAAWSCCCCWDLWCCCCCCWDDFIESCFIFSCSSRSRLACFIFSLSEIYLFGGKKKKKKQKKS